jgi:S-adenosylmethionine decarboxylase
MFGPHLTLDLYGCDAKKLSDPKFVYELLDFFPEFIGMQKFSAPHINDVPARPNSFDKGGVSGFVLLVESHMTIHTFPGDGFASVDIFSCKDFDLKKATECLIEKLGAKKVEKNFIVRGREFEKHYPKSVEKSKKLVMKEREKVR